jgi:type IV pilus assembly protein PilN
MAKINLLPWRDELRKKKQKDFVSLIGLGALVTGLMFSLSYFHIEGLKGYQQSRNKFLEDEIKIVDKKIKEIKDIESKKNLLLTKIEVIQELQESRPQIVHLFDELARTTPEGVYLTNFSQTGKTLAMNGHAQSNARVSAYMRGIENSAWLNEPILQEIQGKGRGKTKNGQLNEFSMLAKQSVESAEKQKGKK